MAKRTDHNQVEIVKALRAVGCSVRDLSQVGKGYPDLLIGYKGRNYLVEVKYAADRAPRLTECEETWIRSWQGQVAVVTNAIDAIAVVQDVDLEVSANQNVMEGEGAFNVLDWGPTSGRG